jgi:hypothetical protein
VGFPERPEQILDDRGVNRHLAMREREIGGAVFGGTASAGHGAPCRIQCNASLCEECLADAREPDPSRETIEQRHPQLRLEIVDLLREGGLSDAHPERCLHKAALL